MKDAPTIKGHRLLSVLGEGGMGRVYLTEDEALGRRAAVKVITERFAADPDARARFWREARTMATVEHPHVVRIYAFGEADGAPYFVMEYVEGEMLSTRIKREGALAFDEALRIASEVVEALAAAWEKGLVHRDIKPSNILLDRKGAVRVADFGLAKPIQVRADSDPSLTATGSILGTPHYLSPEQARGKATDFRSDVYSLGIVLYEMLTGLRPYEGSTPFDIVARHMHEPLPSLADKRPDVQEAVVRVVEWMTAKDPDARPESYATLRGRIDAARQGEPATMEATSTMARGGLRGARGRSPWLAAAAAVGLLAAAWFGWSRASRPAPPPTIPADHLVVAVTPFYGPDEDSAKEGRMMAALVENAVTRRLPASDVSVLGVEETKVPVRDRVAARALGERLGAQVVVWGEAFVLRGETEIQPYFTMVPRKQARADSDEGHLALGRASLEALSERAAGPVVVGAQAANQIELRKTSAAGVGDLVLVLAAVQALYTEGKPEKAIKLLDQAPRSSETLRYRAEALLLLKKGEEARKTLEDAIQVDPKDAQAWGWLGDLRLSAGRFAEAVAAYRHAAAAGSGYSTRQGILFEGKLYEVENFPLMREGKIATWDSGYLLALDPDTGVVRERYRLPGSATSFRVGEHGLDVTCTQDSGEAMTEATVTLANGLFTRPPSLGSDLFRRRRGVSVGRLLAENFIPDVTDSGFKPRGTRADLPNTLPDLEVALRAARERDPTQPWHLFFLGQSQWWQGRKDEASATWGALFASPYPAIPYYEYNEMAGLFEQLGQPSWADRAYEEALKRRKQLAQPIGAMTLIERFVDVRFAWMLNKRDAAGLIGEAGRERQHVWLVRAQEFGDVGESDDFTAAAWAAHYRARGETSKADAELVVRDRTRESPLNYSQVSGRWDYLFAVCIAATLALTMTMVVLLRQASRRHGALAFAAFRRLTRAERQTLLAACAVAAFAFLALGAATVRIAALADVWVGFGDALDSPALIRDLERRLAETPSDPLRFAAGVAHHLAGDTDRAGELYRALDQDPRARKNLDALNAGERVPPEFLSPEDIARAYSPQGAGERVTTMWRLGAILGELGIGKNLPLAVNVLVAWNFALIALVVACLLSQRAPAGSAATVAPRAPVRQRFGVPGLASLHNGWPGHGYAALALCLLVVVGVTSQAVAGWRSGFPCPGFLTATNLPFASNRGLYGPGGSFWTGLWTYRDAAWFWSAAGLGLLVSITIEWMRVRGSGSVAAGVEPDGQTRTRG